MRWGSCMTLRFGLRRGCECEMHSRRSALKLGAALAAVLPVASSMRQHRQQEDRRRVMARRRGERPAWVGWCAACPDEVDCHQEDFVRVTLTTQQHGNRYGSSVGAVHLFHRRCWSRALDSVGDFRFPRG